MNRGDRRPWGEARLGAELWAKVRDGNVAYLVEVIQKGGVFSPICFRAEQPQRTCMEVIVRHGLSESNRKVLKSWIQCTISDYSVCAFNLEDYADTALGWVANSGTPHLTRFIISCLVHRCKKSRDQVHAYAEVLGWHDIDFDPKYDSDYMIRKDWDYIQAFWNGAQCGEYSGGILF